MENQILNKIASSSDGNCYIYNQDLMIDCGVPFSKIKPYYKDIKLLLLTHIHSDHFNKATIKRLGKLRPTLKFVCCKWLVNDLLECGIKKKDIIVLGLDHNYFFGKYLITPFYAKHDVDNCGYKIIITKTGYKIFHATDINSLANIEAKDYNLYCLEANYDEEELKTRLQQKEDNGEYAYEHRVLETHLSKQECNRFLIENMGNNSECVYLHEHIDIKKEKDNNGDNDS